mmetsp:Transcript_38637/g.62569  ORF Transcript_38637/g.62569 Transcript_38637/m.62569 type:complete len:469 (+) Transcript_38637:118-1524(+)
MASFVIPGSRLYFSEHSRHVAISALSFSSSAIRRHASHDGSKFLAKTAPTTPRQSFHARRTFFKKTETVRMSSFDEWSINEADDTDGYVRVLTLDGGGVRGIIGAHLLTEMEKRTGKKISELFDFVCGTSTGGIISVCLTLPHHWDKDGNKVEGPYSAEALKKMYLDDAKTIFPISFFANGPKFLKDSLSLGKALWGGPKYSGDGIDKIADKYIGKELKLSKTVIPILISSFNTTKNKPYPFLTNLATQSDRLNFLLYDVARATSAAPTYLPPVEFGSVKSTEDGGPFNVFIDGGVAANNPSFQAITAAKRILPHHKVFAVSIGTGTFKTRPDTYDNIKKWGPLKWATRVIDIMMESSSYIEDRSSDMVINNQTEKEFDKLDYFRFDVPLDEIDGGMDDASAEHLTRLVEKTDDVYFNDKTSVCSKRFDHVVKRLLEIDGLPTRESTRSTLLSRGIQYPDRLQDALAI